MTDPRGRKGAGRATLSRREALEVAEAEPALPGWRMPVGDLFD